MCSKINILVGLVVFLTSMELVRCEGYVYPQPPLGFDEPLTSPSPIYLPPPGPPLQDDIPQNIQTYLPPSYPPIGTRPINNEILPPVDDSIIVSAPPSNQYLPPVISKSTPIQILNMSCLDSRDNSGYFRVFFRTISPQSRTLPVMESSPSNCQVVAFGGDIFKIDLEGQRMVNCGIRNCGVRMCLILRMAMVPGLRLVDDNLVTLQCMPQETIVSHTKHLRLNAQTIQGRSTARSIPVASGGNQRKFDSTVMLFRKNNGVFDQTVQQGSAVGLGDELLLKTSVREGDGWTYGRLNSVIIRSASSQRSVILVDENGCRNPSMKTVCPLQPQQITPLSVQFPFRAFLFQGAAPADDLLLSVRMSACLRPRDCYQNKLCEDSSNTRSKRAVANISEDSITDWRESEFQFRVLPKDVPENHQKSFDWAIPSLGVLFVILACIVVGLVKPIKKRFSL